MALSRTKSWATDMLGRVMVPVRTWVFSSSSVCLLYELFVVAGTKRMSWAATASSAREASEVLEVEGGFLGGAVASPLCFGPSEPVRSVWRKMMVSGWEWRGTTTSKTTNSWRALLLCFHNVASRMMQDLAKVWVVSACNSGLFTGMGKSWVGKKMCLGALEDGSDMNIL
jgi:hypothetical protein